jgi:ectoine hydroxylase-related dioxygenase (phytanoyl-CoA dioxygenase family)
LKVNTKSLDHLLCAPFYSNSRILIMGSSIDKTALRSVPALAGAEEILTVFREDGCVVIKNMFTKQQIANINNELDPAVSGTETGKKYEDSERRDFHGTNTKRLVGLVNHSPSYAKALDTDLIHELSDQIFNKESGDWWMNTSMCIEIGPGNKAQALHRDQYQFPIFTHVGHDAPEAHVNFFIAMTEFTEGNGATRVIPGSHKWADFSDNGTPEETVPAEMGVGDCFLFSGKVIHGGGANKTQDFRRRAISLAVQASYLVPEEASAFMIPKEKVKLLPPRVQKMLGFRGNREYDQTSLWMVNFETVGRALGFV